MMIVTITDTAGSHTAQTRPTLIEVSDYGRLGLDQAGFCGRQDAAIQ